MAGVRRGLVLTLCLLGLGASPAWAEDKTADTSTLEDIVDGVGGFLKVLVGPPISSPSPYLNLPGQPAPEAKAPESKPKPVEAAVPPPSAPVPAAIVIPSPMQSAAPVPPPPPPPKVVQPAAAPQPSPPPPPPPPTRPAAPVAVPAPVAAPPAAEPACLRVAATATIEQMQRLPGCK